MRYGLRGQECLRHRTPKHAGKDARAAEHQNTRARMPAPQNLMFAAGGDVEDDFDYVLDLDGAAGDGHRSDSEVSLFEFQ